MPRVTALLGAGAAIDIGAPNTTEITAEVKKKRQGILKGEMQYTLKGIYDVLNRYYPDHECNFEDIFHALEMLSSYNKAAWGKQTVYKYKPSISAFIYPNRYFRKYIPYAHLAESDLLYSVAKQVSKYNEEFKKEKNFKSKWYSDFWNNSGLIWDVATLNYDTTIEDSLGMYIDGFRKEKGCNFSRFYPSKLKRFKNKHTCIHLHGCINYGYPRTVDPNKYIFEDDFHDLYKLDNYQEACQTWSGRSQSVTQAGERNHIAPIVTGLRKLEKLNASPYSHYLSFFQNSLLYNPCLLIVGYGFGDLYLNQIMERMNIIHGNKKRVVIITYCPDCVSVYNPKIFNRVSDEEYRFVLKQFKTPTYIGKHKSNVPEERFFISDDGTARLYLDGFKNTVSAHSQEIIDFFNS